MSDNAASPWKVDMEALARLADPHLQARAEGLSYAKHMSKSKDPLMSIVEDHIDALAKTYESTPAGDVLPPTFAGIKYLPDGKQEVHVVAMAQTPPTMQQVTAVWMFMIADRNFDAFIFSCETWSTEIDTETNACGERRSSIVTTAYDAASDSHITVSHNLTPNQDGSGQVMIPSEPGSPLEYASGYPTAEKSPLYGPYLTIRSMFQAREHGPGTVALARNAIIGMLKAQLPFLKSMKQSDYSREEFAALCEEREKGEEGEKGDGSDVGDGKG